MKKNKFDEYRAKDYRVKCAHCCRFMRYEPTAKTPARRRPAPHATTCTECPILSVTGQVVRFIPEEQLYN